MRFPTLITDDRARPIIPLIVQSPSGERALVDALVDTGADISLFSETVAEAQGLDLTGVPESPIRSPLGHAGTYRAVELSLELRRRPDVLQWRGTVGFVPLRLTYALLGTRGFDGKVVLRKRRKPIARIRLVQSKLRRHDTACGNEGSEYLGSARHARKRVGVVSGHVRRFDLSSATWDNERSVGHIRIEESCVAWRFVGELFQARALGLSLRECPGPP